MKQADTVTHNNKMAHRENAPHLDFCRIRFNDKMEAQVPEDVRSDFLTRFCERHNSYETLFSDEAEDNINSARCALKAAGRARRTQSVEAAIQILNEW